LLDVGDHPGGRHDGDGLDARDTSASRAWQAIGRFAIGCAPGPSPAIEGDVAVANTSTPFTAMAIQRA
jgi:hypothetical protein